MSENLIWDFSRQLEATTDYNNLTQVRYRYVSRLFLRWLHRKHVPIEEVTRQHLQDYLRRYRPLKRCGHHLYILKSFFRYVVSQGLLKHDPTDGVACSWLSVPGGYSSYQGILRTIYNRPFDTFKYRLPLFSPHWEAFLKYLVAQRFSEISRSHYMQRLYWFHRFLLRKKVTSFSQIKSTHLQAFLIHHESQFKKRNGRPWTPVFRRTIQNDIRRFLAFSSQPYTMRFQLRSSIRDCRALPKILVQEFLDYCRTHQGLKETTLKSFVYVLINLQTFLIARRIKRISDVTLSTMDRFLASQASRMSTASLMGVLSVARSLFRYLYLHDLISTDIARHLMSPCRFSRDRYPKYLPWHKIQKALDSIDRRDADGIRDYAILSLLAYHGLRPCEATGLHTEDIRWEDSSFTVRNRKNGTSAEIPLDPRAKEALRRYLSVRPSCPDPRLFLTSLAPFRPLSSGALPTIASKHLHHCFGDALPSYGAYLFRHSFAKVMLDRGAGLPAVSAMLGHKQLDSALAYTQIDTEGLREAADNYADLL
jgi:integrase/recombinase XerD